MAEALPSLQQPKVGPKTSKPMSLRRRLQYPSMTTVQTALGIMRSSSTPPARIERHSPRTASHTKLSKCHLLRPRRAQSASTISKPNTQLHPYRLKSATPARIHFHGELASTSAMIRLMCSAWAIALVNLRS